MYRETLVAALDAIDPEFTQHVLEPVDIDIGAPFDPTPNVNCNDPCARTEC
jgi:hypothetical protein